MKVYLAGGMKDGWQDRVIPLLPKWTIFDPRLHGLEHPADYTRWDLEHVREADVILAYMDPANPSGFGMSVELGYASALGKRIIFVDGLGVDHRSRSFAMHRQLAEVVLTFEEAAALLND